MGQPSSLVITPADPGDPIEFFDLSEAQGDQTGRFWFRDPIIFDGDYDRQRIIVPGRDSVDIMKFGYRGRTLLLPILWIDETYSDLKEFVHSDRLLFENQLVSVELPFGLETYDTCQLESGSFADTEIHITAGTPMYLMMINARFTHLGD